jgi:hypothetical protein
VSAGQEVGPLDREGRSLIQPPLPPDEATRALAAAAGVSTVGLRPSFVTPAAAHSHPDCRAILILIVAPHPGVADGRFLAYALQSPAVQGWIKGAGMGATVEHARVGDFYKIPIPIPPLNVQEKVGATLSSSDDLIENNERVDVETAFKNPGHPFRVAIVCAMWLTGFDVECLSTLYIDKPMKAHSLMQAIARANRRYPGKDFGLIVDYNGMLRSLRAALAQYALGDEADNAEEIVEPVEVRIQALIEAIEATEAHLRDLGFDVARLIGASGFPKIAALADAVDAVYTSDDSKRKFEILAREVFNRFTALLTEPSA